MGFAEAPIPDREIQPMLPETLSISGPGVCASDLDNDGLAEIYFSGSRDRPGQLMARLPHLARFPQPFTATRAIEETAPVFF